MLINEYRKRDEEAQSSDATTFLCTGNAARMLLQDMLDECVQETDAYPLEANVFPNLVVSQGQCCPSVDDTVNPSAARRYCDAGHRNLQGPCAQIDSTRPIPSMLPDLALQDIEFSNKERTDSRSLNSLAIPVAGELFPSFAELESRVRSYAESRWLRILRTSNECFTPNESSKLFGLRKKIPKRGKFLCSWKRKSEKSNSKVKSSCKSWFISFTFKKAFHKFEITRLCLDHVTDPDHILHTPLNIYKSHADFGSAQRIAATPPSSCSAADIVVPSHITPPAVGELFETFACLEHRIRSYAQARRMRLLRTTHECFTPDEALALFASRVKVPKRGRFLCSWKKSIEKTLKTSCKQWFVSFIFDNGSKRFRIARLCLDHLADPAHVLHDPIETTERTLKNAPAHLSQDEFELIRREVLCGKMSTPS